MGLSGRRIFLNSVLVTGANILDNMVFLAVTVMAARYLVPEQYGEYATAIGVATFFISFCDIGINQIFIRTVSREDEELRKTAGTMIALKLLLTVAAYGALIVDLFVSGYSESTIALTALFGIIRLSSDYIKTFYDYYDAQRRFVVSAFFKLLFSFSLLGLTASVIYFDMGLYALFTWRLAAAVLVTAIVAVTVLRNVEHRPVFDVRYTLEYVRQGLPFGISNALSNAFQWINFIFLSKLMSTAVVGLYNNAFIFFTGILFIPKSISRVLLPFLYRVGNNERPAVFQTVLDTYARYMSIGGYFISVMVFLSAETIVPAIFGSKYTGSVPMLKISACIIPFVFTVSDSLMIASDRQRGKMFVELAALAVSCAIGPLLILKLGGEGAVIAALTAYALMYVGYHAYLHACLKLSMKNVIVYNIKLVSLFAVSVFIWPFCVKVLGAYASLPVIAVVFACGVCLLMFTRRELSGMFGSLKTFLKKPHISQEVC